MVSILLCRAGLTWATAPSMEVMYWSRWLTVDWPGPAFFPNSSITTCTPASIMAGCCWKMHGEFV